jgi:hypothetical protein
MAYDEVFAARIRDELRAQVPDADIEEKKMFGGLAFMTAGQMTVGSYQGGMLTRAGDAGQFLAEPGVSPFEMMPGKPARDFVVVSAEVLDDDSLARWIARAVTYVRTLPPKKR